MASRIQGITVEIGGNTTKLQTALKSVNSEVRNTQSQLRDVEKLLKLDPGNTELLAQKQRLLAKAVEETKEKLATLRTAAEQANEALANGDITQEQYDALQREIIATEQNLRRLETQADQSSVALQKISATGEKMKNVGNNISSVGQKLMPVTVGITALGTASVTTASNFESAMSQVQATMGTTKDAVSEVNGQSVNTMDTLSALAKKMGSETAFSASECAEALNYLALAGYDTQQMCDTLPTVLNLAAAGNIDLASASDMVTDAMSALGMSVDESEKMVDQMAKTASTTNTSVAQLGEGILTIGATAKSIQGGTAELNTALGILANNGIKGAEGGTHLRNVILSLQSPTDVAAEQIEALGLSVYDSEGNMRSLNDILGDLNTSMQGMTSAEKDNIISKIFNKTDLASVNALLANTGNTWDELQQNITNSGGAAQQMADTQLDNLQGQITILKSAIEGLAISFGELLAPAIKGIVDSIQKAVDWVNSLDEGTKKFIVTAGLIIAAVGPILIIVGKVISAIGTIMTIIPKVVAIVKTIKTAVVALNAVMMANPILLVVAGIAALVAAFVVLWNKCEGFRNFWKGLWEAIKEIATKVVENLKIAWNGFKDAFVVVVNALKTAWNAVVNALKTVWNGFVSAIKLILAPFIIYFKMQFEIIKTVFTVVVGVLEQLWNGLCTVLKAVFTPVIEGIKIVWNGFKDVFTSACDAIKSIWNTICNFFKTVFSPVVETIKSIWNGFKDIFSNVCNALNTSWNAVCSFVKTVFTTIVEFIKQVWQGWKNIFTSVAESLKSVWNTLCNSIKSIFTAIVGAIKSVWSGIKGVFSSVCDAVKGVWQGLSNSIKSIWDGVVDKVKTAWNGITSPFRSVVNKIKEIWEGIRNAIKLPHFSLEGEFSLVPPKIPHVSVDWYSEGGIFTKPTIFNGVGIGDMYHGKGSNAEAVVPLDELWEHIDKLASSNKGINQTNNFYSKETISPAEYARKTKQTLREMLL